MFGLHSSLLVLCATLVVASYANLIANFTQQNINILAPGQDGFSDSSTACMSFDLLLCYPAINKTFHDPTDNLRFTFEPAAIAFPNTAQDVSTILQIAQACNYSVVARSGGVHLCYLTPVIDLTCSLA